LEAADDYIKKSITEEEVSQVINNFTENYGGVHISESVIAGQNLNIAGNSIYHKETGYEEIR